MHAHRLIFPTVACALLAACPGRQPSDPGTAPRAEREPETRPQQEVPEEARLPRLDDADISEAIARRLRAATVPGTENVRVGTRDGVVTLTGTVGSVLAQQRAAEVASMVRGVRSVVNLLEVRPPTDRADPEIIADLEAALQRDPVLDGGDIEVAAAAGRVTLSGTVDSWPAKRLAENIAGSIRGVVEVQNELEIDGGQPLAGEALQSAVERALRWDTRIDDALLDVEVDDGHVRLSGAVGSAFERDHAATLAWAAGAGSVDADDLEVRWWQRDEMVRELPVPAADAEIADALRDALGYEPRVDDRDVDILVSDGVAHLAGTVPTLQARRAAIEVATNTVGVRQIRDELSVQPGAGASDADIATSIETSLEVDPYLAGEDIEVEVDNGRVTLRGAVRSDLARQQAAHIAARTRGVTALDDRLQVQVVDRRSDAELRDEIEDALTWSPFIDEDSVSVSVHEGVVTLSGAVTTVRAREQAEAEALAAGAVEVRNQIRIPGAPTAL